MPSHITSGRRKRGERGHADMVFAYHVREEAEGGGGRGLTADKGPHRFCSATSLIRNNAPIGPYRRPMPRVLGESWGGGGGSYERGTPVVLHTQALQCG